MTTKTPNRVGDPIPCVVSAEVDIQELQAVLDLARRAVWDGGQSRTCSTDVGELRVCCRSPNRIVIGRREEHAGRELHLSRPDGFLGDADPISIVRSWWRSAQAAVCEASDQGRKLAQGPRRCAELLMAAAVAAGLQEVRTGCLSVWPFHAVCRFILLLPKRRLVVPASFCGFLDQEAPPYRYVTHGDGSGAYSRRTTVLISQADLGPMEILRLIREVPIEMVEELRRSVEGLAYHD